MEETINYVLCKRPDKKTVWAFGAQLRQIRKRAELWGDDFALVFRCDYETANETIFSIPYSNFRREIMPFVKIDKGQTVKLEINKHSFEFNWRPKHKFEGKRFRCVSSRST